MLVHIPVKPICPILNLQLKLVFQVAIISVRSTRENKDSNDKHVLHCSLWDNTEITFIYFLKWSLIFTSCQKTGLPPPPICSDGSQNTEESFQKPFKVYV